MTVYDLYGSMNMDMVGLRSAVGTALDVQLSEHDSYFRGIYLLAATPTGERIEVQPNAVPGDDGDEPYESDFAAYPMLVLLNNIADAARADELERALTA